ncbi:hypothetical protein TNCV_5119651 [Trichonephila clavipes]|nr:hypothetical protein TNCV_5119651 [Trichonephila clavipes]
MDSHVFLQYRLDSRVSQGIVLGSRPVMSSETINLSGLKVLTWKLGCQLRCRSRHLTTILNYKVRHPVVAAEYDINKTREE